MKKLIAVAIASTLLVFLSLYAVNAVIIGQQKSKQREISRTLLHYSEDVSQSVALGLKSITTQGCDKTSSIATDKLSLIIFICRYRLY